MRGLGTKIKVLGAISSHFGDSRLSVKAEMKAHKAEMDGQVNILEDPQQGDMLERAKALVYAKYVTTGLSSAS
eukprot:3200707-Prymnesium_polylepis.2